MPFAPFPVGGEYGTPAAPGPQRSWRPFLYKRVLWDIHHVEPEGGGAFSAIKTIHKSTDGGKKWTPVLEIVNPSDPSYRPEFWVQQVAHHLWICHWGDDNNLTVTGFNCDTEVIDWVAPSSGINTAAFAVYDFFARSDGSFIACGRQDLKPHYVVCSNAGVWDAGPTLIDVPYEVFFLRFCLGASDRLHVLLTEVKVEPDVNHVWHISVEADGTQNAPLQSVDDTFNFEFFSNMVATRIDGVPSILVWGRYRGAADETVRAASLSAPSEAAPAWTKLDTFVPPNSDTYDLITMEQYVIALGTAASLHGLEYLTFRSDGTWTDWPVVFWQNDALTVESPHGNKIGEEWGVVFRTVEDKFYYFLVETTTTPPCYTEVRLEEVPDYNPWYLPYTDEKWMTLTDQAHNGPWRIGSDLYMSGACEYQPDLWTHVFRSTDNGRTWKVQDAANAWDPTGIVFHDTDRAVLTSLYSEWNVEPYSVAMKDFDPETNTWGPAYAKDESREDLYWSRPRAFFVKPDGSKVYVFEERYNGGLFEYHLYTAVWTEADGWTESLWISDNIPEVPSSLWFSGAVLDPASGNIHIIWEYSPDYETPRTYYHRVLQNDLTLGPITTLTDNSVAVIVLGPPMVIFEDKLYVLFNVPSSDPFDNPGLGYYKALVGSPAALPTAFESVEIAHLAPSAGAGTRPNDMEITGLVKGGKLVMLYMDLTSPSGEDESPFPSSPAIWRTESADGATWSVPELFFDFWPGEQAMYNFNVSDIGTGMVDGIGMFGILLSQVACGLYKCSATGDSGGIGGAVNYAY